MRAKVTVVGAGHVGGTTALLLAMKGIADVVIIDVLEGLAAGKALDIAQALPVLGTQVDVTGGGDWQAAAGSDVVVVTSGRPRTPGMSRDDLLAANSQIVSSVSTLIARHCPDAVLIVVSNPLDAMAQLAYETTGFPRERVLGMAGVLDTARFRHFAGRALGAAGVDVDAMVLGSHGDLMVPLPRLAALGGAPLTDLIDEPALEAIVDRTADAGAEIVELLGTGSAYVAPAASTAAMVEAVLLESDRIMPCSVLLEGEYGIRGVFLGVPCRLGTGGLEVVVPLDLTEDEHARLLASAESVRSLVERMRELTED